MIVNNLRYFLLCVVFLCLVILRYRRQHSEATNKEETAEGKQEKQQHSEAAMVKEKGGSQGKQQQEEEKALVAVEK